MSETQEIGVGIIGFGVMGRTHAAAYEAARKTGVPVRLRAICSRGAAAPGTVAGNLNPQSHDSPLDLASVDRVQDPSHIFNRSDITAVSICTYTDTHIDLSRRALHAGKHVLVEKPVALTSQAVHALDLIARQADRVCMPAMCMRFWPGWSWLRDRILDQSFGSLRSLVLRRLGAKPTWAIDFYGDLSRSGGALVDLHVHDVDFVSWCLGAPIAVSSHGSIERVSTSYRFAAGPPHVVAEGGYVSVPGFEFQMRYQAVFDEAVAEFDLAAANPLTLVRGGVSTTVDVPVESAYEAEVRHFLEVVRGRRQKLAATLEDAESVTRVLEAEAESLDRGQWVAVGPRPPAGHL